MTAATLEPAAVVAAVQIADDLGTWVLHVARTHPRLADVVGWARVQALMSRGGEHERKAWVRLASWLEGLDPEHYPEQVQVVLADLTEASWRGAVSPRPPMRRRVLVVTRNAKPLPTCKACGGSGVEVW